MSKDNYHQPVLLKEILENLAVRKDRWYLDATLGDGGTSLGILNLGGKVVGIDQDPEALERTQQRFSQEKIKVGSYRLVQGNFRHLKELVQQQKFAGVLFDLGLSQHQLASARRGFSFHRSGPLDMRMDPQLGVLAKDLVNTLTCSELSRLLREYGEVNDRRIIQAIINSRPLTSTTQLAQVIEGVTGRSGRIHPATTVFQALRIAVNNELTALEEGLAQALTVTAPGGVIEVISFHSLEDRIIKRSFRDWQKKGLGQIVTRRPLRPSLEEIQVNPQSRSAKLRIFKVMTLIKRFEVSGILRKQVISLCILVVVILAILEIWAVNRLATFGEEINKLEQTKIALELENLAYENQIASSLSLTQVAQAATELGFVKPMSIEYLQTPGLAAVK